MLAIDAHPSDSKPRQWMKPIQAAREAGQSLHQNIVSFYVREFVQEDNPPSCLRPSPRSARQQNARSKDSPRHRHLEILALEQDNFSAKPELTRRFRNQVQPPLTVEVPTAARDSNA
jgi:hypothetical protein